MTMLFLGTGTSQPLATQLGAKFEEVPQVSFDEAWTDSSILEQWRADSIDGSSHPSVVVALWEPSLQPRPVIEITDAQWLGECEGPFATWFVALTVAAQRCADGGQVVAIVDRPDAKDSAGWGDLSCVADGVEITARSLALIHQGRGVRIHLISTPRRLEGGAHERIDELADRVWWLESEPTRSLGSVVLHEGEL
jgi:hypothetical protein